MNILRYGSHLLAESTPIGLILGATALALTVPAIGKGLRTLAIVATRGVLSISDEAKKFTSDSRESMEDILSEAKNGEICCPSCSDFKESMADLKTKPRRLVVAATVGVLNVSDKAKTLYHDASKQMKDIVEEAKSSNASSNFSEPANKGIDFPAKAMVDEQVQHTSIHE